MLVYAIIENGRPVFYSDNHHVQSVLEAVSSTLYYKNFKSHEVYSSAYGRAFGGQIETQCHMALEESDQFNRRWTPMWTSFAAKWQQAEWEFEVEFTFRLIGHMQVDIVARRSL